MSGGEYEDEPDWSDGDRAWLGCALMFLSATFVGACVYGLGRLLEVW